MLRRPRRTALLPARRLGESELPVLALPQPIARVAAPGQDAEADERVVILVAQDHLGARIGLWDEVHAADVIALVRAPARSRIRLLGSRLRRRRAIVRALGRDTVLPLVARLLLVFPRDRRRRRR